MGEAEIRAGYKEFLFPCAPPVYKDPLLLVGGQGSIVVDVSGREYLDLFAGILTTGIGHCHPEVIERIRDQLGVLGHTSSMYVTENIVGAAKRLAKIAPGNLSQSFFTNSGTEAVETAALLACQYTGRTEIIALRHGYSGRSTFSTNMTGHAAWRPVATSVAGIKHAISPYPYRCPFKTPCDDSCVNRFVDDLEEVILTTTSGKPAAFLAETIQGVGGYITPPPGYFQGAAEVIRKYGGLFICDEVQAGFGRTGDKWFGIEHWDVVPDIMIMAKGIANGFPVGATITTPEIAEAWKAKTISTFGGNPVAMAAASATMDVMMADDTPARSAARGAQLRKGMDALASQYDWIGEVRGMGLMQAFEFVVDPETKEPDPKRTGAFMEATKEEGILVGAAGLYGNVIRVGPSMLISEAETAQALGALGRACERVN
jgi:4-aminobutyrate aminotransferase